MNNGTNHASRLKVMISEKSRILDEIKRLGDQEKSLAERVLTQRAALAQVERSIDQLKAEASRIIVSEHAVLRYLERVRKMDIEKIKEEILPESVRNQVASLGNGTYPINGSHMLKIRDNVAMTVIVSEGEEG